eukprot:SAG31_NODE_7506_length_1669_cov_2.182166_1_plen_61_part_10
MPLLLQSVLGLVWLAPVGQRPLKILRTLVEILASWSLLDVRETSLRLRLHFSDQPLILIGL